MRGVPALAAIGAIALAVVFVAAPRLSGGPPSGALASSTPCPNAFAPAACEAQTEPLPFGGPGVAVAASADIMCGEGGGSALAPRFCVSLPTQRVIAGDSPRPGVADLERATSTPFTVVGSAGGSLFLDASLDAGSRERLIVAFAVAVPDVEAALAHAFVRPPVVYVFASGATFGRALLLAFGYPARVADALSRDHGGVLLPGVDAAVINWESAGGEASIVRHEIMHAALREVIGRNAIPSWLDEGLATQAGDVGGSDQMNRDRYAMRSLVDRGRLRLETLRFSGPNTRLEYILAEEAVDILRTELGEAGLRRALNATGAGTPFADAYARESGRRLADFVAAVPSRLHERLPAPIVVSRAAAGTDVGWFGYGLLPAAPVAVTIEGLDAPYRLTYDTRTDEFGTVSGTFGSTAPPGRYAIALDDGTQSARATLQTTR